MWFYVQMWFPLLTIALTAAICFSVASFIMGQPKLCSARGSIITAPWAPRSLHNLARRWWLYTLLTCWIQIEHQYEA